MVLQIDKSEQNEFLIRFNYSPEKIKKIKKIKGWSWDPHMKHWVIPGTKESLNCIRSLSCGEELIIAPEIITFVYEEVLRKVKEKLQLKGYSQKTQKVYLGHIKRFLTYNICLKIDNLGEENVRGI